MGALHVDVLVSHLPPACSSDRGFLAICLQAFFFKRLCVTCINKPRHFYG